MLREIAILLGAFGCICLFFSFPLYPLLRESSPPIFYSTPLFAIVAFMCLMAFAGFQIRNIYGRSLKGAIVYFSIWLALILIPLVIIIWAWSIPVTL